MAVTFPTNDVHKVREQASKAVSDATRCAPALAVLRLSDMAVTDARTPPRACGAEVQHRV